MPVPIPTQVLRAIKAERGLTVSERIWSLSAVVSTIAAAASGYFFESPMPIVLAFGFCAIVVARLEDEPV